jgi:hypothetical protein
MPTNKPVKAPSKHRAEVRFSLVPTAAQQKMYAALASLDSPRSGDEVASIAISLAMAESDPVIVTAPEQGSHIAWRNTACTEGIRAAIVAAVEEFIDQPKAAALICAGSITRERAKEFRSAAAFAALHKLPILFLVANQLTPGRRQPQDLRTLHAELGIPVFSVDAADAVAAYRVATEALHNARHHRGPALIEAVTIRGAQRVTATPLKLLSAYMERHGIRPLPSGAGEL